MPYTKTTWVNGTTAVSQANMNNLETSYDEATASFGPDFLTRFVLSGGVGTIHGGLPKQLDVTTCVYYALQTDGRTRQRTVNATNFTTVTISTTYFLDYNPDGSTSFATSHSGVTNFVPIISLTTDGSGNIAVITDARPTNVNFLPTAADIVPQFAGRNLLTALVGMTGKFSAQSTAPGSPSDGDLWLDTSTVLG